MYSRIFIYADSEFRVDYKATRFFQQTTVHGQKETAGRGR